MRDPHGLMDPWLGVWTEPATQVRGGFGGRTADLQAFGADLQRF